MQAREEERQQRNTLKQQQLELVEQWQVQKRIGKRRRVIISFPATQLKLESKRTQLNSSRESIRAQHLQAERLRQEAELADERAKEDGGGRDSKAKGQKTPKGKKK